MLDTKWKRLDAANVDGKYGPSQADCYQMFAYGQFYQLGAGELVLIYPKWAGFSQALPVFDMQPTGGKALCLRVVPCDLETEPLLLGEAVPCLPAVLS